MSFDRIRIVRQRKDYTQKEVSDLLNVKRSTYSLWEIGLNVIPLDKLMLFSNIFDVSMDYLCNLTDEKSIKFKHDKIDRKMLGHKIRITRKEIKMSQTILAEKFNITHAAISSYENGIALIPTIFLVEITKITNKSIDWYCSNDE